MQDFCTIEELISLNHRGLFPGPDESDEQFFSRIIRISEEKQEFSKELDRLFNVKPSWISIIYSNESLGFWEGACTWIWDNDVQIQLKKRFTTSETLFFLYSKQEILIHEAVHACRMKFVDSAFEEILAYQSARFSFRRCLGPLFNSKNEVLVTILLFLLGLVVFFYSFLSGMILSLFLPCYYSLRLRKAFFYFNKAKKKIYNMTGLNPLWILLRLTDKEIKMFAVESETTINRYIAKQRIDKLRWKQIYFSYFV